MAMDKNSVKLVLGGPAMAIGGMSGNVTLVGAKPMKGKMFRRRVVPEYGAIWYNVDDPGATGDLVVVVD